MQWGEFVISNVIYNFVFIDYLQEDMGKIKHCNFCLFTMKTSYCVVPRLKVRSVMLSLTIHLLKITEKMIMKNVIELKLYWYTRIKRGDYKKITFRSFKNYTIDGYEKALVEINFPEYKKFDNVNDAYSNFIQKLMEVIDKVAPVKSKRIKRNSQEWFDSEISEKLIIRDKLFKKYKKTRLHVDKEIYKRARYSVQNLIAKKKKEFFENKLKECIGKPKDLWKAIKSLGLPNKSGGCIVGALAENQIVKHDTKSILKTFKSFYSNLVGDLLATLPMSPIYN